MLNSAADQANHQNHIENNLKFLAASSNNRRVSRKNSMIITPDGLAAFKSISGIGDPEVTNNAQSEYLITGFIFMNIDRSFLFILLRCNLDISLIYRFSSFLYSDSSIDSLTNIVNKCIKYSNNSKSHIKKSVEKVQPTLIPR